MAKKKPQKRTWYVQICGSDPRDDEVEKVQATDAEDAVDQVRHRLYGPKSVGHVYPAQERKTRRKKTTSKKTASKKVSKKSVPKRAIKALKQRKRP